MTLIAESILNRRWMYALLAAVAALALLLSACGDDDEEEAPAPAATAAPAEEASEAEDAVEGVVEPQPAGSTEVRVSLSEWAVTPSVSSVAAGDIYFLVDNLGPVDPHEFVIIRTDLPIDGLPTDDTGFVPEDQIDLVGEIEPFTPASSASGVFNLTPGRYLLICNVVELEEGEWESHYLEGMRAEFIVE